MTPPFDSLSVWRMDTAVWLFPRNLLLTVFSVFFIGPLFFIVVKLVFVPSFSSSGRFPRSVTFSEDVRALSHSVRLCGPGSYAMSGFFGFCSDFADAEPLGGFILPRAGFPGIFFRTSFLVGVPPLNVPSHPFIVDNLWSFFSQSLFLFPPLLFFSGSLALFQLR